jgi:hypothetical protein
MNHIKIDDLTGQYNVTYQTTPPVPGFYESGGGHGAVCNGVYEGVDDFGIRWIVRFSLLPSSSGLTYHATLDPSGTAPNIMVMQGNGLMGKKKRDYQGMAKVVHIGQSLQIIANVPIAPGFSTNVTFSKVIDNDNP